MKGIKKQRHGVEWIILTMQEWVTKIAVLFLSDRIRDWIKTATFLVTETSFGGNELQREKFQANRRELYLSSDYTGPTYFQLCKRNKGKFGWSSPHKIMSSIGEECDLLLNVLRQPVGYRRFPVLSSCFSCMGRLYQYNVK